MNIGKQSTLNDLSDLKTDLETQIAAAAAIKVGEVSQIESGVIELGNDLYSERPNGVYYVNGSDQITGQYGMLLHMDYTTNDLYSAGLFCSWYGNVEMVIKNEGVKSKLTFHTTRNTITDANGFIKAA